MFRFIVHSFTVPLVPGASRTKYVFNRLIRYRLVNLYLRIGSNQRFPWLSQECVETHWYHDLEG